MALTPSYAAPEQINSQAITVKTDIFSLAVVAVDILLEKNPLPKDRLLKSCANDEEYIDNNLKKLKVDKDLKNILHKALSFNPNNRYDSMQSFADDLNNWLLGNPVLATSQSTLYHFKKFITKHSALSASVATFVVFLLAASFIGINQYRQIKLEAQKAKQVKQILLNAYSQTNPDYANGKTITAEDILNSTATSIENKPLNDEIKFELLQTIGIAYGQIGKPQVAADYLNKSLQIKPEDEKSLANQIMFLNGAENWQALNPLLSQIKVEHMVNESARAQIYRVIAKTESRQSHFKNAIVNINKAIKLDTKNHNDIGVLFAQRLLAELYFKQSEPQKGIDLLEKILKDKKSIKSTQLVLGLQSDLATLYGDIGQYQKAEKQWQEVLPVKRKILGNNHPELAVSLLQYFGVLRYLGKLPQATDAVTEANEIYVKNFGEFSIQAASSLNSLAIMSYQNGDFGNAIKQMSKAVKIYEKLQSKDYADTLEIKTNLTALLIVNDRLDEALKLGREVYETQLKKLGKEHDFTIYSQQVLAKVLIKMNKIDEAFVLVKDVFMTSKSVLTQSNPLYTGAYLLYGQILDKNKDYK